MKIPSELTAEKALIFRIIHIDNVEWMLKNGLRCKNSGVSDPNFVEIGNKDLIDKRIHRAVKIPPGGFLSDYIPFYFTPFTPMMLNIKTGHQGVTKRPMSELVIMVSSLRQVAAIGHSFCFTDRHAYLEAAFYSSDLMDLHVVDWEKIQRRDFRRDVNDPERFERYQAEALIHGALSLNALLGLVCYGEEQQQKIMGLVKSQVLEIKVLNLPSWFV
ncbi:type II toxin-antitoxin system toxin DNA ADP-ribosyl transferase DarT [Zavarzinella formosa]|uniref:type II toxin-antitoxin system toxin DNA ADP-ribosyl transferase DarT n=1 Tax=Zavarzinella formosa TaxID=360055 RepID=UPI0003057D1B|nr:DUF4433 domain-containing protein [Zavarzinella formosa]